ncbi:NACHT, LRR and PYD domains-containing protein 3-like isoform X8 [Alosa pseudoharengus]|uniref:NACHT, LRR and PYD domains-containing protein 3-like isoform X8 n=1 Tax=Alosa pseudoharengus TaxID=34774 RepID=UPI003F8A19F8
MDSPSQSPPSGASGEVNISAVAGSHVSAPTQSHNTVQGNISNTSHLHLHHHQHHHSTRDSAIAKPIQEVDLIQMTCDYKKWICSQYERVQEYNSLPCEDVALTDRYTDLLIVQKHGEEEQKKREISFRGESFFSARETYQSTTVDQFFGPDGRDVPKAVILQGHSGHGKSFTVKKIMLDWASGNLYQDRFELILHLRCKELNHVSVERCVIDFVSCSQTFTPLISQKLKDSPQKVLVLIDGFDELQFTMSEINNSSVTDHFTPAPVEAILSALLKGSVLSNCFLLVTTRPTAADTLSKLLKRPQRYTETLGFSEKGVEKYFEKFCQDEQVAEKALSRVKANETLFTSCSIPVLCWIVCTVFRKQLKENSEMNNGLETTTSIFVDFVSTLLEHHCQGLSQPVPTLLRSLGQLAERGMLEQRVLFEKESVESKISDLGSVPFLCKFLLKKKVRKKEMFSFMHLSFQEFFTALYYTFDQNEEKVEELLKSFQGDEMKSHLLPVIQFLFGLSNREVMQDLEHLKLPSPSSIRRQLEEWMLGLIKRNSDSMKAGMTLFILHCLYELHEGKPCEDNHEETPFVRRAMEAWGVMNFYSIPLTRTDCWVLLYCLQCCPTIKILNLEKCNITADKLRMLQPALSRCEELGLGIAHYGDSSPESETSGLQLEFHLSSELSSTKLRDTLHMFHQLTHSAENSPEYDECVDALMAHLSSLPDLMKVALSTGCLTEIWANRILTLIHTCPQLREVQFGASICDSSRGEEERGLLLEEGICLLQEAQRRPDCTISLIGKRCCLPVDPCTRLQDRKLRCNILVEMDEKKCALKESVKPTDYRLSAEELRKLLPKLSCCKQIKLKVVADLSDADVGDLVSALGEGDTLHTLQLFSSGLSDEGLQQLLRALSRQATIGKVELAVQTITLPAACALQRLFQHTQIGEHVGVYLSREDIRAEDSLCSSIFLTREKSNFMLAVNRCRDLSPESENSGLLLRAELETADIALEEVLRRFHLLKENTGHDEHVAGLFSVLASLPGLKFVEIIVDCLTIGWANSMLSLCNTCCSLDGVCMNLPKPTDSAESLCSAYGLGRDGTLFRLSVAHYRDSSPGSETSGLEIRLILSSEVSDTMQREILHMFHPLRHLAENSPEYDECVDALMAHLSSLPDLMRLCVGTNFLTEIWAKRLLFLINTCPRLQAVWFSAVVCNESWESEDCLLLKEGVRCLQEANRHPGRIIRLKGLRCCKSTEPCTQLKDRTLSCNQLVRIRMKGESYTERITEWTEAEREEIEKEGMEREEIEREGIEKEGMEREEEMGREGIEKEGMERDDMSLVCLVVMMAFVVITVSLIVSRHVK